MKGTPAELRATQLIYYESGEVNSLASAQLASREIIAAA